MLIPTFGDVVRTHIIVKNLDLHSLFESEEPIPRGIFGVFGTGFKALPKEMSSWLASKLGENVTYWQKVNKALYTRYSLIEDRKPNCTWSLIPKTVDLLQLKLFMKGDPAVNKLCEIDTVVSTKTILGMFLLYWTNIEQFQFTSQKDTKKIIWNIVPPWGYRDNEIMRYLYSKWGEQTDKYAPTVIDLGYMVYLGMRSVPYANLSHYNDMFTFKLSVGGEQHESKVAPFAGYSTFESRKIQVEWNPQFVNLMSMSAVPDRQSYDEIAWADYA